MQPSFDIAAQIAELIAAFEPACSDRETLAELQRISANPDLWSGSHGLFQRIRNKTLRAERERNEPAVCQYAFEEVCAKTLYNLSGSPAPFDADSSEWVLPNALGLAQRLGLSESSIRSAWNAGGTNAT